MDQKEMITRHWVTAIEKQKKRSHRYNVYIDDQFAFSVHEDILVKYRLLKGEPFDNDKLHEIVIEDERQQAYLYAVRILGSRQISRQEMKKRLKLKGYEAATIEAVIQTLVQHQYIDDVYFSKSYTEIGIRSKKKGSRLIQRELLQKGISKENVGEALKQIDQEEQYRAAFEQSTKKWKTIKGNDMDKRRKLAAFLLRRGYPGSIVSKIIKEMYSEVEMIHSDMLEDNDY